MLTDLEIARLVKLKPIDEIAAKIGLTPQDLDHYGEYKAKIRFSAIYANENNPMGKLILVSAITPHSRWRR
jgi:formate--tetrahydrofolate ligase